MFKQSIISLVIFVFICIYSVKSFSLTNTNFEKLVQPKCFNQSTVLGQIRPNGLTVENLISMIERAELQNPDLKPQNIIKLFLERFHYDGLNEHNKQSLTELKHSRLTTVILGENLKNVQSSFDRIENIFTEDEKCNLFFTLSHFINDTAIGDEEEGETYQAPIQSRAPIKESNRHMGTEIPVPVEIDIKKLPPVQSDYLSKAPAKKNKRNTSFKRRILTKRPREYGVSSFLSASKKPIVMSRVLLGLYAGYTAPEKQKLSQILNSLNATFQNNIEDTEINPLIAVTLSDLIGIYKEGLSSSQLNFFGAEGIWNTAECQTKYVLNSEQGVWVTGSDFRGAIDGYNLGKSIELFRNELSASQVLRFYYSKEGFIESGICKRKDKTISEIGDELFQSEVIAYLHLWNSYNYLNQDSQEKIVIYAKEIQAYFLEQFEESKKPNSEEIALCTSSTTGKIESAEIETRADVYFMLDMNQNNGCSSLNMMRNEQNYGKCNKTAKIISQIVKQLKLGRYQGSVSVFYNVKAFNQIDLINDDGNNIDTKLHSRLFNSTSNQCAACRAIDPIEKGLDTVEKRIDLFGLIKEQIEDLKNASRIEQQGLPSKSFYWIDFGTVEPISSDKLTQMEIDNRVLRILKYTHRDVQYFGIGTNETLLKDLVTQPDNLINLNANQPEQFILNVLRSPQIFEYPQCKNTTSKYVTYEGLITPGYRQFWMMSPTQFIRSENVQFSFQAKEYPIEVCFGRESQPEKKKENCKYAENAGETVLFKLSNPCNGKIFQNCPSFFFTINVNKDNNQRQTILQKYCLEKECQNIIQTRWSFTHTGIRCNGTTVLKTSLLFILIAFILQIFYNRIV